MVHVLKSTMAGTLSLSLFLLLTLLTSSMARKSSSSSEPASSNPISLNDRVQQLLDLRLRTQNALAIPFQKTPALVSDQADHRRAVVAVGGQGDQVVPEGG